MCAKWLQSCPALCDPMDFIACQAPLSMGILQERILEWVAMPSSRGLPDPGIQCMSLMHPALAGGVFSTNITWEAPQMSITLYKPQSPCYTLDPQTLFIILQLKVCPLLPNSFLNHWFLSTYLYMTCDMFLCLWFWSQEQWCPPPVVSSLVIDLWGTIFN